MISDYINKLQKNNIDMFDVSIIVPVYNTSQYLNQCLDSLLAQTLSNIEIIVVNDGSTDNSQEILNQYASQYPERVRVYSQPNAGLSEARNTGLRHARGRYIGFVDSDDYVCETMYEALYKKAEQGDFDMACCDVNYVFSDRTIVVSSHINHDVLNQKDKKESILTIYPAVWNKIFRRKLFEYGICFTKNIWFEDCEFLYRLYPHINKIGVIESADYYYRQRTGAITYTYDQRLYQYITNFDNVIQYYKNLNFYNEYKKELEYLFVRYSYATMLKRLARTKNYDVYKEGVFFAKEQVKSHFPHYRKNSIFIKQGVKGYYLLLFNSLLSRLVYYKEILISSKEKI